MSNTYKTDASKFVNNTEQAFPTIFIASMANTVGKMARTLDNKTLTNKEISEVFDYILDECPDDKTRENVDKTF